MKRSVWIYGISLAALVYLLKALEYRYFIRDLTLEFYLGIVAVVFMGLGTWVGLRLTRKSKVSVNVPPSDFQVTDDVLRATGISRREYEVLQLMAEGNSNKEIADKLYVSLNTVKTHSANLYAKLDARRRTQAIQRAKNLQLLP